jgi:hypothetical protein
MNSLDKPDLQIQFNGIKLSLLAAGILAAFQSPSQPASNATPASRNKVIVHGQTSSTREPDIKTLTSEVDASALGGTIDDLPGQTFTLNDPAPWPPLPPAFWRLAILSLQSARQKAQFVYCPDIGLTSSPFGPLQAAVPRGLALGPAWEEYSQGTGDLRGIPAPTEKSRSASNSGIHDPSLVSKFG